MDNDKNNSQKKKSDVTKTIKFKRSSLSEKMKDDSNKEDVTKTVRFKKDALSSKTEIVPPKEDVKGTFENSSSPKTVRLKPRGSIGNQTVKSSVASRNNEKIIVSKDAGSLRLGLDKKVDTEEGGDSLKGVSNAITSDTAKAIEKTLKLKRPEISKSDAVDNIEKSIEKEVAVEKTLKLKRPGDSEVMAEKSFETKVDKPQQTNLPVEKTLKLKRPEISRSDAVGNIEKTVEKKSDAVVEKTLKLKRPLSVDSKLSAEKRIEKEVTVEKTLKLKRPGVSEVTIGKLPETKVDIPPQTNLPVEKTLKLKRPSSAESSLNSKNADNKVFDTSIKKESSEIDADKIKGSISKDLSSTMKLRSLDSDSKVDKKIVSINNEQIDEKENSLSLETTEKNSIKPKPSDNIKIPPLPLKNNSVKDSGQGASGSISEELNLELEAALDALSIDDVKDTGTGVKVENSKNIEKEEAGLAEDIEDISDISDIREVEEKIFEKPEIYYGFTYVTVSLLTLIGLICFLYVSFQSLKLF